LSALDPDLSTPKLMSVQDELTYAISPAGPSDADELGRVHVQAWRETYPGVLPAAYLARLSPAAHAHRWRSRLIRADEVTLAVEGRDGLVGYASGEPSRTGASGEAEITTLYLLKQAQGLGVGRALLTATARVLAARDARSLVIWVLRENTRARAFYARQGGQLDGQRGESVGGGVVASVAYRWPDLPGWLGTGV
jgi:ribosomal protein S18 acetylase RimI-like enzyme